MPSSLDLSHNFHFYEIEDIKSTNEIYVVISVSGKAFEPIGEKNVATEDDNTYTWKHQVNYVPEYSDCDLCYQIFSPGDHHPSCIGYVNVPFEKLTAGGATGDDIRYPVTSSGKVKGELIISHHFTTDGSATGEKVKKRTKIYKSVKRFVKKVSPGAMVTAITAGFSYFSDMTDQVEA